MLKKILIAFSVLAVIAILAVAALFIWTRSSAPKTDKDLLNQLKGEVVFTRSNADSGYEILKYNFQDKSITKIYKCDGICDYLKWSEDKKKIIFYKPSSDGTDYIYQITPEGEDLQLIDNKKISIKDKYIQAENTKIKQGDLYLINDQEKLIYDARYDGKFYTGVSRVSWSPDKKYLIFIDNRYTICIADTNGRVTKLTNGKAFDWKY